MSKAEDDARAASERVGREDVTAIVQRTIDAIPHHTRLYPDLYAHQITDALLTARFIGPIREGHAEDRAKLIEGRMRADMSKVMAEMLSEDALDELVGHGMFFVEHLLAEMEGLA